MRKSPTKITPELIEKLRELVEAGKQNKEISEILGIGTTTITTYKKKYNITYKKLTAEDRKDEIIELYTSGMSTRDIASKFGYSSQTTIKNILNKYGVEGNKEKEIKRIKEEISKVCSDCNSIYEVSKKVGCSVTTVRKYMSELGLSLKLKESLTDEDINNIDIPELKYDFNTEIKSIPENDRAEFIVNKIKLLIIKNRKYTGLLLVKNSGISENYLRAYNINIEEINNSLGIKRVNGSCLELYFSEFCELNNIEYEAQKIYKDCTYKDYLRFDYYLPEYNVLIEIQGKQHYTPIEKFGGKIAFEEGKLRDDIKKEWCHNHNIKLIYISYKDLYLKDYLENLFKKEIYPCCQV